jgi:excinuclease ABC subunit C
VRKRGTLRSVLEEIPGIGISRQRDLLNYFGSVEKIQEAALESLMSVPKMTPGTARAVYDFFHLPGK